MIVLGEAHLRRVLKSYAHYYNGVRTHRSLNKDAPVSRSVQRTGVGRPNFGGLDRGMCYAGIRRKPKTAAPDTGSTRGHNKAGETMLAMRGPC